MYGYKRENFTKAKVNTRNNSPTEQFTKIDISEKILNISKHKIRMAKEN